MYGDLAIALKGPVLAIFFYSTYVFMQLFIEQLLYGIKILILFVLAFLCLANIYRPSLGKVQLGRPNPTPVQLLNFYLRRKRKVILTETGAACFKIC